MDYKDIRRGVTQAHFNEKNSSILFGEILIISILIGLGFKSWWVFGGSLLGFLVAIGIKPLAVVICIALSLVWAIIGFGIGTMLDNSSSIFAIILAIIGFLAGLGTHFSGLEWTEDISK